MTEPLRIDYVAPPTLGRFLVATELVQEYGLDARRLAANALYEGEDQRGGDAFVRGGDRPVRESIDDAVTRGRAYLDAGADLVFVPGVLSADVTRALVDGIGERKVSVIGLPGALTAGEYEALGVARISYGPMTQRVALTALQDVASELYSDGVVPEGTRALN